MSTETKTSEYLLLFRGTEWYKGLSPEEMQAAMNHMKAWFERLTNQGKLKAAQPLECEGKIVSGKKGRIVADGPFAESKEAIGGYFLLQVNSLDEAVAIAKDCPALEYGGKVEVRPIAADCPLVEAARQNGAQEQLVGEVA